jgi:hypothetical protein
MSEVDRLSTSGTYPALPMADRRRSREDTRDAAGRDGRKDDDERKNPKLVARDPAAGPKPPNSLIDEYA